MSLANLLRLIAVNIRQSRFRALEENGAGTTSAASYLLTHRIVVLLQLFDHLIFAFFAVEMVVRILAMGFVGGRNSYLAETWNRLDFFIVVAGKQQRPRRGLLERLLVQRLLQLRAARPPVRLSDSEQTRRAIVQQVVGRASRASVD
ncbi:voltage-dependent T-type calcium channel subunit alpha-1H-like [Tropilaelaps mercedesae]|uniref:Voltage-dependent T-type calcium channel subunit alpha-1H-like n=1 Tax=Tropilaelaps mercedesae TaxID=418985 RepID=A0A1V9Y0D8_9ACAR|nr:voltage-dependent T-type calcium channel subunit alpha-1H-like [Tropilaelaps mercedesae]